VPAINPGKRPDVDDGPLAGGGMCIRACQERTREPLPRTASGPVRLAHDTRGRSKRTFEVSSACPLSIAERTSLRESSSSRSLAPAPAAGAQVLQKAVCSCRDLLNKLCEVVTKAAVGGMSGYFG
jgi:hypothetical protein